MLILLTAVNERIGAGFVGAFEDDKVSEILEKEIEPVERLERLLIDDLIHYERWQRKTPYFIKNSAAVIAFERASHSSIICESVKDSL
jgi:hypothetical protein